MTRYTKWDLRVLLVLLFLGATGLVHASEYDRPGKGITCYDETGLIYDDKATTEQAFKTSRRDLRKLRTVQREHTGEIVHVYESPTGAITRCFVREREPATICRLDDRVIFRSQRADIASFEAEKRGYKLWEVDLVLQPAIYRFQPGPVECSVKREKEASDAR